MHFLVWYKKRLALAVIILVLLVMTITTACSPGRDKGDIYIGVAWPFASNNSLFKEGVQLAVKEINQSGGVQGRKIQLVMKDDQGSVAEGMAIAQSFAKERQVAAVIGHRNSFVSISASSIYEEANLVMLSPASTAPELTQKGYRYIFRNAPGDDEIARKISLFSSQQGQKRMVIFYSEDSYGIGLANSLEEYAKAAEIKIVDRVSYYGDLNDLKRLYNKWKALNFDGIFVASSMPAGAEFIADCAKVGIKVPYYGGNTFDSPQLAEIGKEAAEGVVVGTFFNPDDTRENVTNFIADFTEEYQTRPGAYAAQGYDAVKLLTEAMVRAGTTDPQMVAEQLRGIKDWPGVAGSHSFDQYGNDMGDLVRIKILHNGEFLVIDDDYLAKKTTGEEYEKR